MVVKMKAESIIFDMDGTLWDSSENVAASWTETVRTCGDPMLRNMIITGEDIRGVMGLPMTDIAKKLFPQLSETRQSEILDKCAENENNYLAAHGGILYPQLEETLKELSKEHRLFIVSNCQCGYIEAFFEFCGPESLFTDYLCWGDTLKPKSETIKLLMKKNRCESAVYVGDTQGDFDAARAAGIPFIHAAYGFGAISGVPDASVSSFGELKEIII